MLQNNICHIVVSTSLRALVICIFLATVPKDNFLDFEGFGKMKHDFCQVVDSTSLRAIVIDFSTKRHEDREGEISAPPQN